MDSRREELEALTAKTFPASDGDSLDLQKRRVVMECHDALFASQRGRLYLEFIPPNIWNEIAQLDGFPRDLETTIETCLRVALMRLDEAAKHIAEAAYRIKEIRDELWLRENDLKDRP